MGDARMLLEATLLWGVDTVGVRHVRAQRGQAIRIRDLGLEVDNPPDLVVADRDEQGQLGLRLPSGALVPAGAAMTLECGRAQLRLTLVADDVAAPRRALPDGRVAFAVLAAAALHVAVLGLVAHGREPEGAAEEAARETMQRMVVAADERAAAERAAVQKQTTDEMAAGLASAPAKDRGEEQGAAGNLSKTSSVPARARITRGDDPRASKPSHEEVATFGILAILAGDAPGQRAGSSAFAAETGPSAMGNIFGQTIDDAAGMGGIGLSGAGEGGGGLGGGVSLGSIGTIGHSGGVGVGQGFGCCGGRLPREHVTMVPRLTYGATQVNGRLPPEAIQRIVRQNFGRLRGCYEAGLQRRPDLEGRIAVKFVIDREGQVAMTSAAERSLDDESVAKCVTRAFDAMAFPKPEGGIVTVVYPVVFERTTP